MYSNTIFFTFFAVIFNTGIGLLLAVMLNQRMPNLVRNLYRSIFFFPLLLAHSYIAIIWNIEIKIVHEEKHPLLYNWDILYVFI